LPGVDERTNAYLSAITGAAEVEGLDDKAACRIAFAFLKAYRPKNYSTLEKMVGRVAHLARKEWKNGYRPRQYSTRMYSPGTVKADVGQKDTWRRVCFEMRC
jgi:hypothetical protein